VSVTAGNVATVAVGGGGARGYYSPYSNAGDGGSSSVVLNALTYSAGGGKAGVGWVSTQSNAARGTGGTNGTAVTGGTNYSLGGYNATTSARTGATGYDGVTTTFTGPSMTFAGGGGGGICPSSKTDPNSGAAAGGAGGGGRGAAHTYNVGSDWGQPGTDYLGGGGGGGSACDDGGTNSSSGVTGNQRTPGGPGGRGVVYIKYVPLIYLASYPQSVTAAVGTTATFTSVPYGTIAATRTKKWQVLVPGGSWTDIAGATGSDSYTTPTITRSMQGNQYRYVVTDTYGTASSSTVSTAATLTVVAPAQGDSDTAISIADASTNLASTTVSGAESLKAQSSDALTAEAWFRPTNICTGMAAYCNLMGREGDWLLAFNGGELTFITYNSTGWNSWQTTGVNLPLNQWSHVAITKNTSTTWTIYVNGAKVYSTSQSYSPQANNTYLFYVGNRVGGAYPIRGSIDEVRLWKTDRGTSVASDMTSTAVSGTNLVAYWNFNEASGTTAYNQIASAPEGTDLTLSSSAMFDADVVSTQVQSGAYTLRTFKRSYLTLNGGWKAPAGITRVTTVLVAGGGGGGGGLNGGGGGAGGFIETSTSITPNTYYPIYVGAGGVGAVTGSVATTTPSNGTNSSALSLTAIGGGAGGAEYNSPYGHYAAAVGGSGGGGSWGDTSSKYAGANGTTGQGNKGGNSGALSSTYAGGGGGGAGAVGDPATVSGGGAGGSGLFSSVLKTTLAGGGGGSRRTGSNTIGAGGAGGTGGGGAAASGNASPNTTNGPQSGAENTGGGGGGGVYQNAATDGKGAQGGTGVIAIRWITAAKPSFTAPTNAYLNVGMTETFTTNVAVDSATVDLTRTFRWESSTTGSNGTFSLIKQGTGAANASFSWVPTNTSTSGSNYVYRVIVTDSDTAGLFIVDTSTPVYAVINQALSVSGISSIAKKINLSKSETYTITLGTSTYKPTLSPIIPGISLDTSTAGLAVIKIAETMTVGTYYETLTVVDSVSASVITPLTIVIAAPPTLLNSSEIVSNDLILHLDAGNSQSLISGDTTTVTSTLWKDLSGNGKNGQTTGTNSFNGFSCAAPTYYQDFGGYLNFNGVDQCYWVPYLGTHLRNNVTVEAWYRTPNSSIGAGVALFGQAFPSFSINLDMSLGSADASTTSFKFGVYNGSTGTWQSSAGYTPTANMSNVWTHMIGTYDGLNLKLYVNGTLQVTTPNETSTSLLTEDINTAGYFIGRAFLGASYFNGSIASIRVYDVALTSNQVSQNYNATKTRFLPENSSFIKPVQKYGNSSSETYTVTSGIDTKTVALSTGSRLGIGWDTATASTLKLKMYETLTVGTYYDTVTVTDNLGQSTYLPLKMIATKADTVTVTVRNPATNIFTGSTPTNLPTVGVTGLVSTDTGTVVTTYRGSTTWGATCATGGTCVVGDTGPGGGKVFKVSPTIIDSATGISSGGIYLEIAPKIWNGDPNETALKWSTDTVDIPGTVVTTGSGAENNRKILAALGSAATTVNTVVNSTYNGLNDWFLPSSSELQELYNVPGLWVSADMSTSRNYWTSTQDTTEGTTTQANSIWGGTGGIDAILKNGQPYYVRPIRAFSPVYISTVVPTEVETYTASAKLNLSSGSLSNYYNVVYETSTLTITQANQNKIILNLYGAVAGSPFTLQISGGSGDGAVTETLTAGGDATNCALSNRVLSNSNSATEQRFCRVTITKAASRNYKVESLTASVYFMVFINNQPVQIGSGATIGLNGVTSYTVDTTSPPTITSLSATTISIGAGGTFTINGTGFTGNVVVRFYRNKPVTPSSSSSTALTFNVAAIGSAGATTGRVTVITDNGQVVSTDTLVINP
jgi:hypothetical protein